MSFVRIPKSGAGAMLTCAGAIVLVQAAPASAQVVVVRPPVVRVAPIRRAVIIEPPPPMRVEAIPGPRPGWIWTGGYWRWSGRGYVWVAGAWVAARPGYAYLPAHWDAAAGGWTFVPAAWVYRP